MIVEYNPLHAGHLRLLELTRRQLGAETAVICVMSGDFVQRGDFALVRRQARGKAAIMSGVDLVLELPLPWAVASAEGFADGAIRTLAATGLVEYLTFGSECGDAAALMRAAAVLKNAAFPTTLREELSTGVSFPTARVRAVTRLAGETVAAVLSRPNDLLGVEYCKSLLACDPSDSIIPVTFPRQGSGHGQTVLRENELPAASAIRAHLRAGERDRALRFMAPAMRTCYLEEEQAGRAPVFAETCERAILSRLRSMTRADFSALDEGREGVGNRLYQASRTAASVDQILERAKTKRYAYARLRRMILWAFLGITPMDRPPAPFYLRPLAMNRTGQLLLARMRKCARVPVLTRAGAIRDHSARSLFTLEARAADLHTLAYPDLTAATGGTLWRERLWIDPSAGKEPAR